MQQIIVMLNFFEEYGKSDYNMQLELYQIYKTKIVTKDINQTFSGNVYFVGFVT